jgi:hypothetical protein
MPQIIDIIFRKGWIYFPLILSDNQMPRIRSFSCCFLHRYDILIENVPTNQVRTGYLPDGHSWSMQPFLKILASEYLAGVYYDSDILPQWYPEVYWNPLRWQVLLWLSWHKLFNDQIWFGWSRSPLYASRSIDHLSLVEFNVIAGK